MPLGSICRIRLMLANLCAENISAVFRYVIGVQVYATYVHKTPTDRNTTID